MSTELEEELKEFERDLGRLVARFMRLYDRVEAVARPKTDPASRAPLVLRNVNPPTPPAAPQGHLPGYQ